MFARGTTIEAVRVLEDRGFRAAVIEAMAKCMENQNNSVNPESGAGRQAATSVRLRPALFAL